jgi:hypothetical protein
VVVPHAACVTPKLFDKNTEVVQADIDTDNDTDIIRNLYEGCAGRGEEHGPSLRHLRVHQVEEGNQVGFINKN